MTKIDKKEAVKILKALKESTEKVTEWEAFWNQVKNVKQYDTVNWEYLEHKFGKPE